MWQFGVIFGFIGVGAPIRLGVADWTQVDDGLLDLVNFDFPRTNDDEGLSIEENWVNEAVLDVAYYLRSHKFNEYDRRMKRIANDSQYFFAKFPDPPLKSPNWEVVDHCEDGFMSCLKYIHTAISDSKLSRSMDTITLMKKYGWRWDVNQRHIEKAEEECKNLYDVHWVEPEPFQGPLHRFQFRVTASYYMCKFTMERRPELAMFGEPCDNFGSCLINGSLTGTKDPRADDRKPFACSLYSFCPDPCCPVRHLKSDVGMRSCAHHSENPCMKYLPANNTNKDCLLDENQNSDLTSLMHNRWNTTCCCSNQGYKWDSRFATCVDMDECQLKIDSCNRDSEICYNLEGSYYCGCARGWWYDHPKEKCVPIPFLKKIHIDMDFLTKDENFGAGDPSARPGKTFLSSLVELLRRFIPNKKNPK